MAYEMAQAHADLYPRFKALYRPNTLRLIRMGQGISAAQHDANLAMQREVRARLLDAMQTNEIDLWIAPAATGSAPRGIESTGNSALNLVWTLSGLPVLAVPTASRSAEGLPFGVQMIGAFGNDERVLRWGEQIAAVFVYS